jgi:2'-5' RNA ligase
MDDLFPNSLLPEELGFDVAPLFWPLFFALYPREDDLPRVVDWQCGLCRRYRPELDLRSPELLHVSVEEWGRRGHRRQPLRDAIAVAEQYFAYPSFEITFIATVPFGAGGNALVAIADSAGNRTVDGLRNALADAQEYAGIEARRGRKQAHMTLGYFRKPGVEGGPIEPFGFKVAAVDLVLSNRGHGEHMHLARWRLQ